MRGPYHSFLASSSAGGGQYDGQGRKLCCRHGEPYTLCAEQSGQEDEAGDEQGKAAQEDEGRGTPYLLHTLIVADDGYIEDEEDDTRSEVGEARDGYLTRLARCINKQGHEHIGDEYEEHRHAAPLERQHRDTHRHTRGAAAHAHRGRTRIYADEGGHLPHHLATRCQRRAGTLQRSRE